MKVVDLLEARRKNWRELEQMCGELSQLGGKKFPAERMTRFAALYRSACADLALADAYQLPHNTVQYLHRLVGLAHNRLYRSRRFRFSQWMRTLLVEVPQRIFADRCVQIAFVVFWGSFLLSAWLAANPEAFPAYAEGILQRATIAQLESSFSKPIEGRDPNDNFQMAGFYIHHNTGIGLQCFVWGLLVVPGIYTTLFNGAFLGAAFGYMARPDVPEGANFFHFVTAHGPFELTAIVLAGGAGLRLGISWMRTLGFTRGASLRKTAAETMPLMGAAMFMFFMAALIEGFLSPSSAPYWIKAAVAIVSTVFLLFYFFVLGFPRRKRVESEVG